VLGCDGSLDILVGMRVDHVEKEAEKSEKENKPAYRSEEERERRRVAAHRKSFFPPNNV
jgi:hypothetical protein